MTFVERLEDRLLSNPRADRVKDVAALTRRSMRSKRGLFRAEGPQNVREAVRLALVDSPAPGLPRLDAVYVTLQELDRHPGIASDLTAVADRGDAFVRAVTPEVLAAMTDAVTPQGMLAVCRFPSSALDASEASGSSDDAARALGAARLVGMLVRVQDPGNAGTVIRTADAAGADAVLCTPGTVDPFNPKSVRSSAGSLFHVPVFTGMELAEVVAAAREHGMGVLAADGYASMTVSELADAAVRRAAWRIPSSSPPRGCSVMRRRDCRKRRSRPRICLWRCRCTGPPNRSTWPPLRPCVCMHRRKPSAGFSIADASLSALSELSMTH